MGNIISACVPWINFHQTPSSSSKTSSNVVLEMGNTSNNDGIFNHPMSEIESTYTLGEKLGQGSYGTVCLAINKMTGEQFACKSIKKVGSDRTCLERIRREVEIMHHLRGHPNIVNIHEVFEENNDVHIVMELCEGKQLVDHRDKTPYTEDKVRKVFRQIMEAICYCHRMGVMHRDLKMDNFMFFNEENSHLKAIDFGFGTFFKPETNSGQAAKIRKGEHLEFNRERWGNISSKARSLVEGMLQADPETRLSTDEIMNDEWFVGEDGYAADGAVDVTFVGKMKLFQAMNKFKRVALKVIAEGLLAEETAGLRNIFESFAGNDNKITFEALKVGLNKWGIQISDTEAKELMDSVDLEGNGTIGRTEFISATMNSTMMAREGRLRGAFQLFANGSFITRRGLKQALDQDCMAVENQPWIFCLPFEMYTWNEEAEEIFAEVDTKKDGRIDYDEFEGMMMGNN